MTYLEKTLAKEKAKIIDIFCPGDLLKDAPRADYDASVEGDDGSTIGCRGLTCRQCWEQDAKP